LENQDAELLYANANDIPLEKTNLSNFNSIFSKPTEKIDETEIPSDFYKTSYALNFYRSIENLNVLADANWIFETILKKYKFILTGGQNITIGDSNLSSFIYNKNV